MKVIESFRLPFDNAGSKYKVETEEKARNSVPTKSTFFFSQTC